MANFALFFPILLRNEGYYANVHGDSGGETWEGISRNNYPSWSGWAIVDAHKPAGGFVNEAQANVALKPLSDLQSLVMAFYKKSQWDTILADQIQNQSIANFIADWGVNSGMSVPVKHAQKVLNLTQDGQVGPKTIGAINAADGASFFTQMQAEREAFYHAVVAAHPIDAKFLPNWLSRNKSFSYSA